MRLSMSQAVTVTEVFRLPSPAPSPQALACDGAHLWLGSAETKRLYGIDRTHFTVFEEADAKGEPIGAVCIGDELRVVNSHDDDDNRVIRRFVPGHGMKDTDIIRCPDDTGSYLAFDGTHLWLTHAHAKSLLQLDAAGVPVQTITLDIDARNLSGIVFVDGALFVSVRNHNNEDNFLIRMTSLEAGTYERIADIPFRAVSLTHDGVRFWTSDKQKNELVAFEV